MLGLFAAVALAGVSDSWCQHTFQAEWALAGLDAPCAVIGGDPATRLALAKEKWKLTDEQAACAVAAENGTYSGDPKQWRTCVERWPEVTVFWAALLDSAPRGDEVSLFKLTAAAAGKIYALENAHSKRVADIVLAAKPKELVTVLSVIEPEPAFDIAWSQFSLRKDFSPAEWDAVGRSIIVSALARDWFTFATDVWLALPSATRTRLVSQPIWSERDERRRIDLRSTLAFALTVVEQKVEAKRVPMVTTPADARSIGATRARFFERFLKGAVGDSWELAVGLISSDLPDEAFVAAFTPLGPKRSKPIGTYVDLVRAEVSRAVLRDSPNRSPPASASTAVYAAHTRAMKRLAALSGLADGGLAFDEETVKREQQREALMSAASRSPEEFQAAFKALQEDRFDGGLPELPTIPSPFIERTTEWRGDAGVPTNFTRRGFSVVRAETTRDGVVALATSQRFDPTGEVSPGGYWLIVSSDRGVKELYLGLSEHRPYRAHEKSQVPLLRDGVVRLDVKQAPIDESTITFPPVSLKRTVEREHVILEVRFDELERDSDGDGLSDLCEVRLLLDPANADTDGDGVRDGDDALPRADDRLAAGPSTQVWAALLDYFGVKKGLAPVLVDPSKPAMVGATVPRDFERTTFLVAEKNQLAGVHPLGRFVTLSELELRAARRVFGSFFPMTLRVRVSDDGKHAFVWWSDNPSWGTARVDLRDGKWVVTMLNMLIS